MYPREVADTPVVQEITGVKRLRAGRLPGFRRTKPTESREALAEIFGDKGAKKISERVTLDQQFLVFFQWAGSGQDKLACAVAKEDDRTKVVFTFRPGRTRDLRPHAHLYAIRKGVTWGVAK